VGDSRLQHSNTEEPLCTARVEILRLWAVDCVMRDMREVRRRKSGVMFVVIRRDRRFERKEKRAEHFEM
jgi:hypothetical protein